MRAGSRAVLLVAVALAVLLPFASTDPDGLQRVAISLGVGDSPSGWGGLLSELGVFETQQGYVVKLVEALLGLTVTFFVGWVVASRMLRRRVGETR